jgi:glycosyltransferase involved in cell wall biosynthesis
MKVLHVITHLGPGGIERWLLSMLEQIPRTDCAMDICCKGASVGPYAPSAQKWGAEVHHQPLGLTQIGFISGLRKLVAREKYDVVHNHLQAYSGLPALACQALGVPIITSFHCTAFPPETWLRYRGIRQLRNAYASVSVKYALHHSTMFTGCSQDVINTIRKTYGDGNGAGWRVLYYGTQLPQLPTDEQRRELRQSFGWPGDVPVIIHVGRFAEQKNHFGLIRIFEAVSKRIAGAKLLLVGGGPLRPAVETIVQELGLSDSVKFLGYRDDVPALMARSDVFLFPSWFEGLGVAALEASAAAIPVVASNVSAIAEAVEDNVTGLLRDPHDVDSMADAVALLLTDASLSRRFGTAGRERIAERFSNQVSAGSLLQVYHECLS